MFLGLEIRNLFTIYNVNRDILIYSKQKSFSHHHGDYLLKETEQVGNSDDLNRQRGSYIARRLTEIMSSKTNSAWLSFSPVRGEERGLFP